MWISHSIAYLQSGIQSGVYHNLYIRRVESVSTRVRCPIKSGVSSGVQYTGKDNQLQYNITYYVIERQLPLPRVIDASHTTPITRVNRGPKLLKLSIGDIVHALGGSRTYLVLRPRCLTLNQALPSGSQ